MAYRARAGLTYPDRRDLATVLEAGGLKGLQAADPETFTAVVGRMRRVEAGQSCDDVPVCSISWLLEQGQIEAVDPEPGEES